MHEAKTHLSRLVQQLRDGVEHEIIIAVSGAPYARLVPYDIPAKRTLGLDRGLATVGHNFDAVDNEIAGLFNAGKE